MYNISDLDTITLNLEDGSDLECAVLCIFTMNDIQYTALLALNEKGQAPDDAPIYLYRFVQLPNGEITVENIDSDEEMDEVSDYYLTRVCLEADVDYDINYKEYSRWDNKVNGEIVITNLSDRKIEDGNLGLQVIYCLSRFGMLNILMMRQKMFWKIWDITKTWNRGSPFPLDL